MKKFFGLVCAAIIFSGPTVGTQAAEGTQGSAAICQYAGLGFSAKAVLNIATDTQFQCQSDGTWTAVKDDALKHAFCWYGGTFYSKGARISLGNGGVIACDEGGSWGRE